MGFWAVAAPALISAGSSLLSGMLSKKPAIDPNVLRQMQLSNEMTQKKMGYLDKIEGMTGRGTLKDSEGNPLILKLGGGWNKSLNEFMNAADFGSKRDMETFIKLATLAQAPGNAGAVQQGANMANLGAQKAASGLGKLFNSLGQAVWDAKGVGSSKPGGAADLLSKIDFSGTVPGTGNLSTLIDLAGGEDN